MQLTDACIFVCLGIRALLSPHVLVLWEPLPCPPKTCPPCVAQKHVRPLHPLATTPGISTKCALPKKEKEKKGRTDLTAPKNSMVCAGPEATNKCASCVTSPACAGKGKQMNGMSAHRLALQFTCASLSSSSLPKGHYPSLDPHQQTKITLRANTIVVAVLHARLENNTVRECCSCTCTKNDNTHNKIAWWHSAIMHVTTTTP